MRYAVLGTGIVGQTIGSKLLELGHQVKMGSRTAGGDKATEWVARSADLASEGTFADAAGFGEIIINATKGAASLAVLEAAGAENVGNKVIIDISNPLEITDKGPSLSVSVDDSVAEQIQRTLPNARVVKTLNMVTASVMVNPALLAAPHNVFVAGNDSDAKSAAAMVLQSFGWPLEQIVDLGDLTGARAMEAYILMWIRLFQTTGTPDLNIAIVRK